MNCSVDANAHADANSYGNAEGIQQAMGMQMNVFLICVSKFKGSDTNAYSYLSLPRANATNKTDIAPLMLSKTALIWLAFLMWL